MSTSNLHHTDEVPRYEARWGYQVPGRDTLHEGEVANGGNRIYVWASPGDYGISVVTNFERRFEVRPEGEEFSPFGPAAPGPQVHVEGSISLGRLSVEMAEALITELTLAVRATKLAAGEPWQGREVAPGVVRAPEVRG